jgi:hypothetical protein
MGGMGGMGVWGGRSSPPPPTTDVCYSCGGTPDVLMSRRFGWDYYPCCTVCAQKYDDAMRTMVKRMCDYVDSTAHM